MTMKKLLGIGFALLISSAAFAADNAVIVTPGTGVTMKSKDIGSGVQAMQPILSDASGNTLLTTVGADAVSNTLTGIPVYSRALYFNGTTWDRWQGAVTNAGTFAVQATLAAETTKVIGTVRVASGGIASGSIASGAVASGAIASGAYASGSIGSGAVASGAIAAGALAVGAGVDGWDLTQGAIADASVSAGATGSVSAKLRRLSTDIDAVKTSVASIDTKASQPLPAQTGIGNVNIGAVQSAGSAYETVAASQTAQALGATGATGDYLSHCVIYPVTTGAGAVTVFDNTNAAGTNVITFTSGTLSNLAPIAIPVGAISTAGAWKVTTGANVTVTCFGKFT